MLDEVARVLGDDGLLIISTPDRRAYGEARTEPNPFHARELSLEEFIELLDSRFPHTAAWGQRTITGSHLNPLGGQAHGATRGRDRLGVLHRALRRRMAGRRMDRPRCIASRSHRRRL